ncbi:lysylphosphatidylglycerol synthase transmembrane domain-containing protein [Pelagibius sp. Alg239-R121]|uniref:lysylphosphatidylglycerol synthase transmembrane domain-containing protein n=1 Tax=Pelagibius sp. Alg239-R121 TaxID=2993448 RepID=UPI0024A6C215|nr:lysylphosphatidylglycerol synthase transmembrane domain-containing protein [Pelagibius sp. Alg239-R121]
MNGGVKSGKTWRLLLLGIAVGGFAAWLVFANTDVDGVLDILQHKTDYLLAGAALLTYSLFFFGKALRWRYLLGPIVDVPPIKLTPYVLIGYAGNVLLPFQAGEAARGLLLSKHHGVKAAAALSGIALEKLLDFFALLLLLVWALWSLDVASPVAEKVAVSLAGLLTLGALALAAILIRPAATAAMIDWVLSYCPQAVASRLGTMIHDALDGLAALRQGTLIAKLLATSLASWGVMLITLCLSLQAVQLEVPVAVAIVVLMLAAVGLALPTSPGFIGTLQAAFVLGMVPFGVDQEAAVAASLLYQFLTTVPPLIAGGICLARL